MREITENILSYQAWRVCTAVNKPADDRDPAFRGKAAPGVSVFNDGVDQRFALRTKVAAIAWRARGVEWIEAMEPFPNHPAVVAASFDDVDFFKEVLTYVAQVQLAISAWSIIKGELIWIAQPIGINLIKTRLTDERIGGRNGINGFWCLSRT